MLYLLLIIAAPIVAICLFVDIYCLIKAFISKAILYKKIKKICFNNKYTVIFKRRFLASFFKYSNIPDIMIDVPNIIYNIRIITCKNKLTYYVFPSDEYFVSFQIIKSSVNPTGEFRYLPKFDLNQKDDKILKENKNILLFIPFLPNVSMLNDTHTQRIKLTEKSCICDWEIHSAKSFLNILEK